MSMVYKLYKKPCGHAKFASRKQNKSQRSILSCKVEEFSALLLSKTHRNRWRHGTSTESLDVGMRGHVVIEISTLWFLLLFHTLACSAVKRTHPALFISAGSSSPLARSASLCAEIGFLSSELRLLI